MYTQVTQLRLSQQFQETVGVKVDPAAFAYLKGWIAIGGSAGCALFTILLLVGRPVSPYLTGVLVMSSVFWLSGVVASIGGIHFGSKEGTVRFRVVSGCAWISHTPMWNLPIGLWFALLITTFPIYTALYIVGGAVQNAGNLGGVTPQRVWILGVVFFVLSVYIWQRVVRAFRENAGVRLAPDRVGINHEHSDLFLQWTEIERVSVELANKGTERKKRMVSCVRIEARGTRVFQIEVTELGSDPNVVAALMQYYLERPQERDALADPEEAIRRFRDAQDRDVEALS